MAKRIGVIVFAGFETLDVYGPLGLLVTSSPSESAFSAILIGEPDSLPGSTLLSSSNLPTLVTHVLSYPFQEHIDILLIPGGLGNRRLFFDDRYLHLLSCLARNVLAQNGTIFTGCTGSIILLAGTGLLNGKVATTNKRVYGTLTPLHPRVHWRRKARWTVDGRIVTSSGVTAGIVCPWGRGTDIGCCVGGAEVGKRN
jgi:putative intracellular protease/amidase